ncbi:MAG: hypothetical protein H3C43_13540 [Leptonema sp. (in: Bacteria)]|nr:hypothetical protein [Leptonema sp. (in: bacteria)]
MISLSFIEKVRLPVSLWLSLFLILVHCTDYVDWERQEKAQTTLIAALSRIGTTQTAEQPERYFINNEEAIAAEEYLADMAEYLPSDIDSKERNQQWLKAAISYSAPSALDFESELSALREGRTIPKFPELTLAQQVAHNREQMQQFEAAIITDLSTLPNEQLEILRINSFLAIASIELFPDISESLDVWNKESVNEALRLHERIRRLAIDELGRR